MISILISDGQTKIETISVRYGVNTSEVLFYHHTHNASESLILKIVSDSDKYNVFFSEDYGLDKSNDSMEKYLPIDILEAPEDKLILEDHAEAQINFIVQANTDFKDFAILSRHDLNLEEIFQRSYDKVLLSSNEPKSLLTDVTAHVSVTPRNGGAVTKTIHVHFVSFNASEHYGLYCLQLFNEGSPYSRDINTVACVDVIPAKYDKPVSTFEPGVRIDTCSSIPSGQTEKLALYKEQSDCIVCTFVGLDNPEVNLYHKKQGMAYSREIKLTTNIFNSNYAKGIAYTIKNPTDQDAGLYTCVAFNEDQIKRTSKKAVLTEPLNVTTNIQGWNYTVCLDFAILLCFIMWTE